MYDCGEVGGGKREFGVALNGKEVASWFNLVKSGVEWVVGIPFSIRSHEKVTRVDFENACENELLICAYRGFFDEHVTFKLFIEDKFAL